MRSDIIMLLAVHYDKNNIVDITLNFGWFKLILVWFGRWYCYQAPDQLLCSWILCGIIQRRHLSTILDPSTIHALT